MSNATRVVVIGAGAGGLAAALELAAEGYEVTLLERHAGPGGKMRELHVDGRAIDSGPTVFTMRWVFEDLFVAAGRRFEDYVDLTAAEDLARHFWQDGSRLDLYADLDRSVAAIEAFAGAKEAAAYRRFADQSAAIFDTLDHTFMRAQKPGPAELGLSMGLGGVPRLLATKPFATLWSELGRLFGDPRLRQLFGRYATYCGSSPFEAPATLMLIAHAERCGVWLVNGGMQRLAEGLANAATEAGAELRFGAHVESIDVRRRRVRGVVLAGGERLEADAIVFNGDVAALSAGLLGKDLKSATRKRAVRRSLSAVTWSRVATVASGELAHHTVLFGDDYPGEFERLFSRRKVPRDPTVYVCAQDRGPGRQWPQGDPERLFFLMNAPARELDDDEIEACERRLAECLAAHGIELQDETGDPVVTTPGEFGRLFPATDGALYGRPTHGSMGSFDRPGSRGRIRGLYFAGGSVHPGPGVPMTTQSGRLAAASVREDFDA